MTKLKWNGFSKKTPQDRIDLLNAYHLLSAENQAKLEQQVTLSRDIANQMVENVVGQFSLPFAIAPDFLINGKPYQLPMVTEEPSVVAAASFAAKIIKRAGGFTTTIHNRETSGIICRS